MIEVPMGIDQPAGRLLKHGCDAAPDFLDAAAVARVDDRTALRCRERGYVSASTAEDEDTGSDLPDGQGRVSVGDPGQGDQSARREAVFGKNIGICRVKVPAAAADVLLDHLRFPSFQLSYKHP